MGMWSVGRRPSCSDPEHLEAPGVRPRSEGWVFGPPQGHPRGPLGSSPMVRGAPRRDARSMPETPSSPDPDAAPQADPDAPTTQAPPADAPPPKRLLRARDDRVIGGVCGGIAQYFGIDPLIVRIAAVALAFI